MNYKFGVLLIAAHVCTTLALPPCVCTRNFRPVCGSDGKTYSNACTLNCERSKGNTELTVAREGSCDVPAAEPVCICPYNYAPVCGNDGITYANECGMQCARSRLPSLEMQHTGECRDDNTSDVPTCACTRDMKPVCGSDGNTYNNICLYNCAAAQKSELSIQHEGRCADKVMVVDPKDISCACTRNLKPVCGSDGITYNNPCLLNCATASNPNLRIEHEGACSDSVKVVDIEVPLPSCACTRNLQPVCGSDGNTYSNACLLNCATASNPSLSIAHEGSCDNSVRVVNLPLPDEKPTCSCTRNLEPVCGSDGVTYSNECLLKCAGNDVSLVRHEPCDLFSYRN